MRKFKVLDLCLCAALIALHIVLELFCTVRIGNYFKFTFATLPLLTAGMLLGPLKGVLTAFCAVLLSQLLTFGITATTPFWILPGVMTALSAALIYRALEKRQLLWVIAVTASASCFVLVIFNFIASYFDGIVIFKYLTLPALLALIPVRLLTWAIMSIVYTGILFALIKVTRHSQMFAA